VFLVEATATLPFTPESVFAATASIESTLRWQVGVLGVRRLRQRTDGALRLSYWALGARHQLTARVTAYDPPQLFAYRAEGEAFDLEVELHAAPHDGGSRLTYRLRLFTPSGPALPTDGAGSAAALRRLLGRRAPRDLRRLEALVGRRTRVIVPPPDAYPRPTSFGTSASSSRAR
jgi:uncharacterized protein YndB with AHSA1/START domain